MTEALLWDMVSFAAVCSGACGLLPWAGDLLSLKTHISGLHPGASSYKKGVLCVDRKRHKEKACGVRGSEAGQELGWLRAPGSLMEHGCGGLAFALAIGRSGLQWGFALFMYPILAPALLRQIIGA